jgi:hypothetical protein
MNQLVFLQEQLAVKLLSKEEEDTFASVFPLLSLLLDGCDEDCLSEALQKGQFTSICPFNFVSEGRC